MKSAETLATERAHRETRWWLILILAVFVFGSCRRIRFENEMRDRVLWRFPTKAETERAVPT